MKKYKFQSWHLIVLLPLAYIVFNFLKKAKETGKILGLNIASQIKNSAQVAGVNAALQQNGISPVRTSAIQTIADDIYAALYKDSFFGLAEDEVKAADSFNQLLTIEEAKACAGIYRANFKKSLYDDLHRLVGEKHLKSSLFIAIKSI